MCMCTIETYIYIIQTRWKCCYNKLKSSSSIIFDELMFEIEVIAVQICVRVHT